LLETTFEFVDDYYKKNSVNDATLLDVWPVGEAAKRATLPDGFGDPEFEQELRRTEMNPVPA
jgi:hypothetical protein